MKIGLVCPYNLFKGGGVQECVFLLQKELAKRGHDVLILTPQARSNGEALPDFVRVLGTATDMKTPLHTTAQVSISLDTRQLDELLAAEQFDLLHFHEPWMPLLARQILGRSDAKNVATFHAKLPDTMMSKALEKVITPYTRSVLKHLDALTAVSDAAADYVRGLTDRTVEIVPNGIDVKRFKKVQSNPTNTIFYIGRLEKRKGVKYLLQAFALLRERLPDAKLVIAGDGPGREKLEEQCQELEVDNVSFMGYISDEEKFNQLSQAGVFCSPALYGESFGIVLLEAMAAGVPIVAGDNPGYATVMQGRGMLSLIDPEDTENFARRLELLLTDQTIRQAMVDWANEHVDQYDYSKVVDQYEQLYKRLVTT
jgi:phosphatidyl-myo-inositol alpha-mannosyltransferase